MLLVGATDPTVLLLPIIGWFLGWIDDQISKKTQKQQVRKAKKEAEKMSIEAEENLKRQVADFMAHHHL